MKAAKPTQNNVSPAGRRAPLRLAALEQRAPAGDQLLKGETMTHEEVLKAATKRPWHWNMHDGSMISLCGRDDEYDHVFTSTPCPACAKRGARCLTGLPADRELIVRAVNSHEKLVEAVEAALDYWPGNPGKEWAAVEKKLRAALALARGE